MTRHNGDIVLVDDEMDVLNTVQEMLSAFGFMVHGANSAVGALDILNDHPTADLLLTDVNMPEIDGYMLADMVKVHNPCLRVLYMTGRNVRPLRQQGICHGPTIMKPFRIGQLAAAVERCFDAPPGLEHDEQLHAYKPLEPKS